MIREIAVDPGLLSTWERFRYITEKFGVCNGRLISRYPKRWKALVYDSLKGVSEIERKRIEVKLQGIDDKLQTREHGWNTALEWLANAELEHGQRPFHAILALANPRAHGGVLTYDELDETLPLWAVERERVVSRTAAALAAAVAPLLKTAKVVIFVDPHFDPYKDRVRSALSAFLDACLVGRPSDLRLERVEFHTAYKPDIRDFAGECTRQLPKRIPEGLSLKVLRWSERQGGDGLHNRYILTERGGVRLAWGLDEGRSDQTDDISLLEQAVFNARWGQYCGSQPGFDCAEQFVITGARKR